MKKIRFGYFSGEGSETERSARALAALFANAERSTFTKAELDGAARALADDISKELQEHPDAQQENLVFLGEILTAKEVLSAMRRQKRIEIDYKQAPMPTYEGDTHLYLEQADAVRKQNAKYKKDGIYTVRLRNADGTEDLMDVTLEELDKWVRPVRQAVLEQVRNFVDPSVVHFVDACLSDDGRVARLHDGTVLKAAFDWNQNLDALDPEQKENHHVALRLLYALPERSPYLAYQILGSDFSTEPHEGTELQTELPIVTLDVLLMRTPPPPLRECLGYVVDAMRGAEFLVHNRLRLTDLAPHNIAIDDQGRGLLFDYDGLFTDSFVMKGYMTHPGYCPPERLPDEPKESRSSDLDDFFRHMMEIPEQKRGVITEAAMAYELGTTLCEVYKAHKTDPPEIVANMTARNPEDRPTLAEAIHALTPQDGSGAEAA